MPDPTNLPPFPSFDPADGSSSGLGVLAAAAAASEEHDGRSGDSYLVSAALHAARPYNPAATLTPKVVKRILTLEFMETSELRGDIWFEDSTATDPHTAPRRSVKPPVISIKMWLECYTGMASVDTFPGESPRTLGLPVDHPQGSPQLRGAKLGRL